MQQMISTRLFAGNVLEVKTKPQLHPTTSLYVCEIKVREHEVV